jgi:uncharacterized Fe-S center protein
MMASDVFFLPASADEEPGDLARKTLRVYSALGISEKIKSGHYVALKIHFGEKKNTGYIRPAWLVDMIGDIKKRTSRAFITDTNTLYVGNRSNSVEHLQLAFSHGFGQEKLGIPVVIADGLIGQNDEELSINLSRVKTAKIASPFLHTDILLCLSHFTGHILTGFGAAIKNLGMGCASRAGKLEQHSDVHPWIKPKKCQNCMTCAEFCPTDAIIQDAEHASIRKEKCIGCGECLVVCPNDAVHLKWDRDNKRVQEKMAEYAFAVWSLFPQRMACLNYMLRITKDCDCMSENGKTISSDIGILGSLDPVAVEKAGVDLVLARNDKDVLRMANDINWNHQLEHAVKIGLGSLEYKLHTLEW